MAITLVVLSILLILSFMYIIITQLQLRKINSQLSKRLRQHTRQPITLELINKELNTLVVNINKCLKLEKQLRIEEMREGKRFKDMIANISHDLRTPLTAIKGYQQLLEKGVFSDEQRQRLKIAQKHTNELGILIENFFEYSYLVNSNPKLNIEAINLTNLLTECLAESVYSFEKNNLKVYFEETESVFVLANQEMSTRIIQNLIRNCIQHSAGDIKVQLLTGQNALISFSNPVKNVTEIDIKQIFERFYTGDKARIKKTGLGLSIVKLLAEQMDGRVSAFLKNDMIDIRVELPLFIKY